MSTFRKLRHWLQKKIYNAVLIIHSEDISKSLGIIKSSFKKLGNNFKIGRDYIIDGTKYIEIGDNFRALSHFRLQAMPLLIEEGIEPSIKIGDNVSCEDFCHIGCVQNIVIGDGTLIASKVYISDHSHGQTMSIDERIPIQRNIVSTPVMIGKHCWIGDGACILPGVILGDNVIVGANAVVTHSFPSNSVIGGVPAKMIHNIL